METIKTAEVVFEKHYLALGIPERFGSYNGIDNSISRAADPANGLIHFAISAGSGQSVAAVGRDVFLYTLQESRSSLDGEPLSSSSRHLAKVNLIAPLLPKKMFASFEGQEISRQLTVAHARAAGSDIANITLYSEDLPGKVRVSASLHNLFNNITVIRWAGAFRERPLSRMDERFV